MAGEQVARAPTGWRRIGWLGPGFLWMVSAAGSGELLFTPRVGSLYGYALVWAIEAAHIPVVAGLTLYLNHRDLPRPLRPSPVAITGTSVAGLFFVAFTVFYLLTAW